MGDVKVATSTFDIAFFVNTHAHTVYRLPPGVAFIPVHEVDDVFDAVAVSVAVVGMLGVTLEALV